MPSLPVAAEASGGKRVWISWNRQRRNIGLARSVNATLYMSELRLPRCLRLVAEFFNSWMIILREKPDICFVMNPSIFASWWMARLKKVYGFILVTDLHTVNIRLEGINKKIFLYFFRKGLRDSDMVIVTNPLYRQEILPYNQQVVCIPDQLPRLRSGSVRTKGLVVEGKGQVPLLVVSSFAEDEPLDELVSLDNELSPFHLYITGNWKKRYQTPPTTRHITFLGYMADDVYDELLLSVDGIIVLTTVEGCLCCGAYEAFAAEKPLILSNTRALRDFFEDGPIYTEHEPAALLTAFRQLGREKTERGQKMAALKKSIQCKFDQGIAQLEESLCKTNEDTHAGQQEDTYPPCRVDP